MQSHLLSLPIGIGSPLSSVSTAVLPWECSWQRPRRMPITKDNSAIPQHSGTFCFHRFCRASSKSLCQNSLLAISVARDLFGVIGMPGTTWQRQRSRSSATRSKRLPMSMELHTAWPHIEKSCRECEFPRSIGVEGEPMTGCRRHGTSKDARCYWHCNSKPRKAQMRRGPEGRWGGSVDQTLLAKQ